MRIKMKQKYSAESHCECSISDNTPWTHTHTGKMVWCKETSQGLKAQPPGRPRKWGPVHHLKQT